MLRFALAVLLSGSALAQTHAPVELYPQQLDEIRGRKCEVPEGFGCGLLFDLDLPESGNMNLSVVGGVVHRISVILNGSLPTTIRCRGKGYERDRRSPYREGVGSSLH
jgi:hypothetical protein